MKRYGDAANGPNNLPAHEEVHGRCLIYQTDGQAGSIELQDVRSGHYLPPKIGPESVAGLAGLFGKMNKPFPSCARLIRASILTLKARAGITLFVDPEPRAVIGALRERCEMLEEARWVHRKPSRWNRVRLVSSGALPPLKRRERSATAMIEPMRSSDGSPVRPLVPPRMMNCSAPASQRTQSRAYSVAAVCQRIQLTGIPPISSLRIEGIMVLTLAGFQRRVFKQEPCARDVAARRRRFPRSAQASAARP